VVKHYKGYRSHARLKKQEDAIRFSIILASFINFVMWMIKY